MNDLLLLKFQKWTPRVIGGYFPTFVRNAEIHFQGFDAVLFAV